MNRLSPTLVYLLVRGGWSLFESSFFFALAVYYVQTVGMNPLQLVLVGTTIEVSIFIFEIPTGVVADTYSRKLSVIIGLFLIGSCFILEGLLPVFAVIILAEFLRGIGETFVSGAFSAWLTDEIGEEKVGRIFLRAGQLTQISGIVGTGVGIAAATILPLGVIISLGGFAVSLLAVFMIFAMPETGFQPTPRGERTTWQAMGQTLKNGSQVVRRRPLALTIVAIGLVYGLYSEGYDRLFEAHFLKDFAIPLFAPAVWFGLMWIVIQLTNFLLLEVLIRRVKLGNSRSIIGASMVTDGLLLVSLVIFALAGNFYIALAACWIGRTLRMTGLYEIWVNRNLDSKVRATVLSFNSQIDALGQFIGGPFVGFIGVTISIPAALLTSALLLSPTLLLYSNALRLNRKVSKAEIISATAPEN